MEEGKVVETGGTFWPEIFMIKAFIFPSLDYDELRCRPDGIFARMVAAQEIERHEEERSIVESSSEESEESEDIDSKDNEEEVTI